jgi:hypothetical protein
LTVSGVFGRFPCDVVAEEIEAEKSKKWLKIKENTLMAREVGSNI